MCPSGGKRGGPVGHGATGRRAEAQIALAGSRISRYRLIGLGGSGRKRTVPDKGFPTRKKGAAEAAPSSQFGRPVRPPSAGADISVKQPGHRGAVGRRGGALAEGPNAP